MIINGNANREDNSKVIFSSNEFSYELISNFPKYPNPDWEFKTIASGCCDSNDVVYLLVRDGLEIVKLDIEGNYLGTIKQNILKTFHFCCITPDNNLLIVDVKSHCAVEITKEGEFVREFGNRNNPSDTGADWLHWQRERRHGKLFPTEGSEAYSNEKWAFYETLRTVRRRGVPFNRPTSCVCNNSGEYIFGDGYGNCAIHRFNKEGKLLSSWGNPAFEEGGVYSPGPGKFAVVHGIAVDSKNRIWANDRESDAINVYNHDGTIAAYICENLGQPSDIWFDGTYMYVVGRAGYLTIFNMSFKIVAELGYFNSDLKAHGMCGNSKGDLFLFPTHANPEHQVIKLKRIK